MTDTGPEEEIAPVPGTEWYSPNQQAVRPDGSGAAEEGEGGSTIDPSPPKEGVDLESMTKDELLAYAADHGVSVHASMVKDDIKAAIVAAEGGG